MMPDDNDLTLHALQRLAVLEPDRTRSERLRARCRAAIGQPRKRGANPGRFRARVLESTLIYGLSVGYLAAIVHDLLRVYMRR